MLSRLEFVKLSASALVGISAGQSVLAIDWAAGSPAVGSGTAVPATEARPTAALFRPYLSSMFTVTSAAGASSALALAKVEETLPSRRAEHFSLVLHGDAAAPLADGIYNFRHPDLGPMDLFINKVGSDDPRRAQYQACFGYLRT